MSKIRIRKNDTVIAVSGNYAGQSGKVMQVFPARGRAVVEGLAMIKKTLRKSQDNPQGGVVEKESTIDLSNLLLYCSECKKGVRVGHSREADRSVRTCRVCGHAFDT